jgi:hypothetical protein
MSAVKDTSNLVELSGLGPNQKEGNQVKRIRGTYYDHVLERTAWDILIKVIKAYKGEILVPTYLKCKKEYFTTFTQRFEDVIDVLKASPISLDSFQYFLVARSPAPPTRVSSILRFRNACAKHPTMNTMYVLLVDSQTQLANVDL